jgi:ADP-heptose:LPS heptosyltransferase
VERINVKIPAQFSLKEFYQKKDRILILNEKGGLGDVFMQRFLISGIRDQFPDAKIDFGCLPEYLEAVTDHPDIDNVYDAYKVNPQDYIFSYNTCVTIADRYENKLSPYCEEHRADIWAKYCGFDLKIYDMRFRPNQEKANYFSNKLKSLTDKKTILFSPISKMISKTLLGWQIKVIVDFFKDNNCFLIGSHKDKIEVLEQEKVFGFYGLKIQDWIAAASVCDYIVSVDSALFHLGGGLRKPMTGIFTFVDGKTYGKYFDFCLVQKHRDDGCWDCGPCFKFNNCPKTKKQPKPCLTELTKEEIEAGLCKMLGK